MVDIFNEQPSNESLNDSYSCYSNHSVPNPNNIASCQNISSSCSKSIDFDFDLDTSSINDGKLHDDSIIDKNMSSYALNIDISSKIIVSKCTDSKLHSDNDSTLNSTKSLVSDNYKSCDNLPNLDLNILSNCDVPSNSNSNFDNDCTLNSAKSLASDNCKSCDSLDFNILSNCDDRLQFRF